MSWLLHSVEWPFLPTANTPTILQPPKPAPRTSKNRHHRGNKIQTSVTHFPASSFQAHTLLADPKPAPSSCSKSNSRTVVAGADCASDLRLSELRFCLLPWPFSSDGFDS